MCCNYLAIVVENGHDLANGGSGIIVGTGTQRMEQMNRSLVELNLNAEPIGILGEHGILTLSHTYARCFFNVCFVLIY
jgi:hypothetical protein